MEQIRAEFVFYPLLSYRLNYVAVGATCEQTRIKVFSSVSLDDGKKLSVHFRWRFG